MDGIGHRGQSEGFLQKSCVRVRSPGPIWGIHYYSVESPVELFYVRMDPFYNHSCRLDVFFGECQRSLIHVYSDSLSCAHERGANREASCPSAEVDDSTA